jgi:basic amino acid/polyamine antiporter, APA family
MIRRMKSASLASPSAQPSFHPPLKPALTLWDLTAVAINGVIGAGIFGLPAVAAGMVGVSSPLVFMFCALVVSLFVMCFAEVAGRFSDTGGPYVYSRTLFGPFVAFEIGWCAWLARLSSYAANSNLLVAYLGFFVPALSAGIPRVIILVLVSTILAVINIRGVTAGAKFVDAFAAVKVGALVLFGAIGLGFVDWARFSEASVPGNGNWGGAMLLVLYAFMGFENAAIPSGEARSPRKHTGWALIIALAVSAAIYVAVQIVAVGTVPNLVDSDKPLADAAQVFIGPAGAGLISLLACISIIGNIGGTALIAPRLTYAFSERKDFPALFGRLHAEYRTPVASILLFTGVACALAISGQFIWLATMSVLARLTNYFVTCVALPLFRRRSAEPSGFKVRFGSVVAIAGSALCIWLFAQASWSDLRGFAIACVAGGLLYFARPRKA